MANVSVSLPSDGDTIDVADYNTPINTIVTDYNGNIDNSNIATAAAIAGSKLANGSVTPTKWTNPYCFRAYASGATTLTDATFVVIALATENYDYSNNFASNTYTAPVAGVYHFNGSVTHTTASSGPTEATTAIFVNGTRAGTGSDFPASTSVALTWNIAVDLLLAQGDTVDMRHYQDSGGNEATNTGTALTWFAGHLVHAI